MATLTPIPSTSKTRKRHISPELESSIGDLSDTHDKSKAALTSGTSQGVPIKVPMVEIVAPHTLGKSSGKLPASGMLPASGVSPQLPLLEVDAPLPPRKVRRIGALMARGQVSACAAFGGWALLMVTAGAM
jgi:hypothetical protein